MAIITALVPTAAAAALLCSVGPVPYKPSCSRDLIPLPLRDIRDKQRRHAKPYFIGKENESERLHWFMI